MKPTIIYELVCKNDKGQWLITGRLDTQPKSRPAFEILVSNEAEAKSLLLDLNYGSLFDYFTGGLQ